MDEQNITYIHMDGHKTFIVAQQDENGFWYELSDEAGAVVESTDQRYETKEAALGVGLRRAEDQ